MLSHSLPATQSSGIPNFLVMHDVKLGLWGRVTTLCKALFLSLSRFSPGPQSIDRLVNRNPGQGPVADAGEGGADSSAGILVY